MEIAHEFYLSVTTDGGRRRPVVIASAAGGMEIEEVARTEPERVLTEPVDPAIGFQPFQGRRLAERLGLPVRTGAALLRARGGVLPRLRGPGRDDDRDQPARAHRRRRLLALDAKVSLDDDALFRHGPDAGLRDATQEDPLEVEASEAGIAYVKLDGDVGCMVNGAGLAMATMDTVKFAGAEPANFLDRWAAARPRRRSAAPSC